MALFRGHSRQYTPYTPPGAVSNTPNRRVVCQLTPAQLCATLLALTPHGRSDSSRA